MPIYRHPKFITDVKNLSRAAREIVKNHPWGYWGGLVRGPRGRGKSAFCMHTVREVYQYSEGITYDDAWERTLDNVMFSLEDIDKMLNILDTIDWSNVLEWQKNNTVICKWWDDAGMHGGKYKYFVAAKLVEHLQGNMDVLRFILTGFLINAPEISNLLKFLREYRDHKIIKVAHLPEGTDKYGRVANVKIWREDRLNRWRLIPSYKTRFSCYVDDWVYEKFSAMKARAIIENRKRFQEMMKKVERMQPDEDSLKAVGLSDEFKEVISP